MSILGDAADLIGLNKWYFIVGIGAAAFVGGLGIGWHEKTLRIPALISEQMNADTANCMKRHNADTANCMKKQASTKGANDELQKDRDTIAARLHALELQHPERCVPVRSETHTSTGGGEHAGSHGVSSDALRNYAADCETYRSEVITLSDFLDEERK